MAAMAAEVRVAAERAAAAAVEKYMNNKIRTAIWVALGFLLLCIVGAFFAVQYVIPGLVSSPQQNPAATSPSNVLAQSQYQSAESAHTALKAENAAYLQANKLRIAEKYADAATAYRTALAGVTDVAQRTEIQFWLAYCDEVSGNYTEAVATYKEIAAASTTVSKMTRAYAIQDLAHMYYRFGDPAITQLIFKDEPYKSLSVPGHTPKSYRKLFDYAASLYPLALSEAYSADWYANQLLAGTTTRPEFKDIIREKLQLAQKDMATVQNDPAQRNTFLNAFERYAVVLGKMKQLGDPSFADPEMAFKELLQYFVTFGMVHDGTERLQYAYYLAHMYGKERAPDIRTILAPVDADPASRGVSIIAILRGGRSGNLGAKANLVLLASIDPAFKKTLLSLGWIESDFK